MNGVRALLDRELLDGEVDVVTANLDEHPGLGHLLTGDERARARRFHFRVHRERFVAARGLLRLLLGERLDADPGSVRITTGAQGKPRLESGGDLCFNLAHSGRDALYAFTHGGDVGVDIEAVRSVDPVALSKTCFSNAERDELLDLHPSRRLDAFFHGWARKEAVIKADGRGMSLPLDRFSVTLCGPARLRQPPPGDDAARWRLASLDAGPDVRAAVAVRRPPIAASSVWRG
jgi:4'-phosphopantetheinyl transferase